MNCTYEYDLWPKAAKIFGSKQGKSKQEMGNNIGIVLTKK